MHKENKISGEGDCERKELEGSGFIWVGKFAGLWGKCGVNGGTRSES